ncbi:MAG: aspartyl protease family protein [Candidatus Aminicenantes bacterium]|nr:aspartyl protease family protein [Candidatus Aminicenantes bacterium]
MNNRARILLTMTLAVIIIVDGRAFLYRQSAAGKPGTEKLASLLLANSFREAERLAAQLLAAPALDAPDMAVCGLAVLKAGRILEAEAIFKKVLLRSPDEPDAHLGLGRIAFIRNDLETSVSHLRRAVPTAFFYDEALRHLWRASLDRGRVDDLFETAKLAEERFARSSKPLPSFFTNGLAQVEGLAGKPLFRMEGRFERIRVPLVTSEQHRRTRMISLALNRRGDYLFHIDSALAGFMTLSPLLAEELGLVPTGSAASTGVGTAPIATRFAVLDTVGLGPVTFGNVPVMVSDIRTLRGMKKGLIGTAFLKRFNTTIDVEAGTMDLFPLDRPDLLARNIDQAAVAADVPLHIFEQTVVEASVAGAPAALYILDSAAATNLVDTGFFEEHIQPKIDPAHIVQAGIQGAGGAQNVRRVDGLSISLGPLVLEDQQVNEFRMGGLNEISGRYAAGLLGNPLLWPYRVHMNFRAGRLILERYPRS